MAGATFTGLGVVVVNYASSELLSQNLVPVTESLPGAITVVVDNLSSVAERRAVSELTERHGWTGVFAQTNAGFGEGMNAGVSAARSAGATAFLLLNPDATIDPSSVGMLLDLVRADPRLLVAPTVLRPDGTVWFGGADVSLEDGRIRSRARRLEAGSDRVEPWLSGACLMVSDELWREVGGFQGDYFLYWEDVDLSYRIRRLGGRIEVVDSARAVHAEGGTQGVGSQASGTPKSTTYYYYNIRNRLVFAARHLSVADVRRWRRTAPRVAWEVLLEGGRRQLLRSPRPALAAARGLRDGLRLSRRGNSTRKDPA